MDRLLILSVISGMVYFIQIYRSAELRCQIQIVAYKKQGGVLLPALFHQHIQKRDAPIVIQSRGRLIGHYKFRSADQCPGCSNALLLTDGELTYLFAPAVLRQIKFAQQLLHPLFNRALLFDNIGNYNEAIKDISAVIKDYPEFWEGYRKRAEIRRKIGDNYGAERDEFKILQARMAVSSGTYHASGKTRKKSEHNIDEYDKLVEEDVQEAENEYANEYRGLVQNRQTELKVEPLYVLTYNCMPSELRLYVPYSKQLDDLNANHLLPETLYLTINEASTQEEDIRKFFERISQATSQLEEAPGNTDLLLQRAMDYYHVRDFENCIADLNDLLAHNGKHVIALMLRAQCRYAQLEVSRQTTSASDLRLGHLMVLQDYSRAAELQPDMPCLYYNQGFIHVQLADYSSAIEAFTKALDEDEHFPEAYYSRGVIYLITGKTEEGLSDLSQAGEYGIYSAYNLIKRHSIQKK